MDTILVLTSTQDDPYGREILTLEQLEERLNEEDYYGEDKNIHFVKTIEELENARGRGYFMLIFKGEVIIPKKLKVVTKFKVE